MLAGSQASPGNAGWRQKGGKQERGPLPGAPAPQRAAPPGPGPAPAPEEDWDPQEGEVKEGPYPAGSGRGARRGFTSDQTAREGRGAGAAPRLPRCAETAASPAQGDPEGRRSGRAEGRSQDGAGPRRRLDRPLPGRGEELPTAVLAWVVPYELPVTPQGALVANVLWK